MTFVKLLRNPVLSEIQVLENKFSANQSFYESSITT